MNKIEELIKDMPDEIDAVIVKNGFNRFYFTNFSSTAGVLVITKKSAYFLLDFRYFEMAQKVVKGVKIICFSDVFEEINKIFKKENVKNVAVETKSVSISEFEEYKTKLNEYNFTKNSWLDEEISSLRSVKTEEEVEKIRRSQEVVDAAFSHILNFISAGKTEKQVAREIENFILDNAQATSFSTIVVSGKNSSLPHGVPTEKILEDGDFVTMDFGAILDGYCSDMTRTVVVKKPSNFQRELYKIVLDGQELALKTIKEGLICNEVDAMVRRFFKKFDYDEEFGHGLGHGVGIEIHENPRLNKICKTKLKKNMVVTVEPGIYINSKMGLRIEDMVVVKENGILNLTKSSKELICV